MNPPLTSKTTTSHRRRLVQVFGYYILCYGIVMALISSRLPFFMPFVLVPLLWFCTRRSSPLKPPLPERPFSLVESWLWFGGAGICGLVALGFAYVVGNGGALGLFKALAIGAGSWAFGFLTFRDCRRTLQKSNVA